MTKDEAQRRRWTFYEAAKNSRKEFDMKKALITGITG